MKRMLETEIGEIILREAELEDANKAVEFMNWVTGEVDYHTYGPNDFNIKPEDERRMMDVFHKRNNCLFIVGTFQDEIVAVATLSGGMKARTAHRATVGITVAKRYWRLGVGKNMMDMMFDFCKKSKEVSKLELLVHEKNDPAIKLYNKLGFKREGIIERYFMIEGTYFDGYQMGKIITKEV